LASKVNLVREAIPKIFELFEDNRRLTDSVEYAANLIEALIKDKFKLKEKVAELEEKLSIQNTTPQELAGEECKNCPIKEAKISELKTSLDQANQD